MNTDFVVLTDLWFKGQYFELGNIVRDENWTPSRIAEFCFYFAKHIGLRDLEVLHKFL